ncbi:MAG: Alpha-D-ribose 1-methylphosphonate 5-triphosphate diphosphatase [Firmicutes bacterium]|nr:Alpha-D-ribose 1-methylphosphonate 5-triphosphate diphosphatase [Bacillota bacterium]
MYLISNGKLVFEDRIAENYELLIKNGRINKIAPAGEIKKDGLEVIDARGGYVSPGFIDIHSDYIEHMAAPRPASILDFKMAVREIEKQLINQGVTTMYHSLSLMKDSFFTPKKIRNAENVKKLVETIEEINGKSNLIHHKFHARYEIDNVDHVEYLLNYIKQRKIHLLSFMDHTPGQGQYRNLEIYKEIIKGYEDMNDDEIEIHIKEYQNKQKLDLDTIGTIARIAGEYNVPVASHDDDTVEKLDLVRSYGTVISEFPITIEVARAAKERGMYTAAGAPNVLLGGSHTGNLSAAEAIEQGCIDILCSDYYPASLLHAVFLLHKKYGRNLVDMFKLVTVNPAKAVGISEEYGSLSEGRKGDIIIIEKTEEDFPVITAVFVDGRLISKLNYIG